MSEINKTAEIPAEEQETGEKKKKAKKEKKSVGQEILSWVITILVAVVAALVIRSIVFEPVRVDGASMDDTLAKECRYGAVRRGAGILAGRKWWRPCQLHPGTRVACCGCFLPDLTEFTS